MGLRNVLVLFLYLGSTETKVLKNFNECNQIFYKRQSPSYRYLSKDMVYICQQYNNTVFYATLYDTKNRIPVYSALELDLTYNGKRLDDKLFIEPMLATNWGGGDFNMIEFESSQHSKFGKKQALGTDYSSSGYDKGHVNPQMFNALSNDSRYATNIYTNIAPQYANFNQNTWAEMEQGLLRTLKKYCIFEGAKIFVIVGVEPSIKRFTELRTREKYVERVNVPKFYWTAVCCDTSMAASLVIAKRVDRLHIKQTTLIKSP